MVVAQGSRTKNLIPISTYHRRNPHLMAIQSAIGDGSRRSTADQHHPQHDRAIRTDVVRMSDGVIHGCNCGSARRISTPERSMIGLLKWDSIPQDRHAGIADHQWGATYPGRLPTAARSPRIYPRGRSTSTSPGCCRWWCAARPRHVQHLNVTDYQAGRSPSDSWPAPFWRLRTTATSAMIAVVDELARRTRGAVGAWEPRRPGPAHPRPLAVPGAPRRGGPEQLAAAQVAGRSSRVRPTTGVPAKRTRRCSTRTTNIDPFDGINRNSRSVRRPACVVARPMAARPLPDPRDGHPRRTGREHHRRVAEGGRPPTKSARPPSRARWWPTNRTTVPGPVRNRCPPGHSAHHDDPPAGLRPRPGSPVLHPGVRLHGDHRVQSIDGAARQCRTHRVAGLRCGLRAGKLPSGSQPGGRGVGRQVGGRLRLGAGDDGRPQHRQAHRRWRPAHHHRRAIRVAAPRSSLDRPPPRPPSAARAAEAGQQR